MRIVRISFFILALSWITSGCVPLSSATPSPTLQPTETPLLQATSTPNPTPLPTISPLTTEMLKNGTYTLPQYSQTITLVNGKYESRTETTTLLASLLDPIAFGDLNGDGLDDAALLLAENGGGTGVFVSVITILNQGGVPIQNHATLIDDRPQIKNLMIQNNQIIIEATIHGTDDPGCCPNFPVTETYQWSEKNLILTHLSSLTPTGEVRDIHIEAPTSGEVASSIQLTGNVTISPFENNLAYRIYDSQRTLLAEGPVQVLSETMGAPGTFDAPIDLSSLPSGAYQLELLDLSAADGSILAMDSVQFIQ